MANPRGERGILSHNSDGRREANPTADVRHDEYVRLLQKWTVPHLYTSASSTEPRAKFAEAKRRMRSYAEWETQNE